MLTEYGKLVRKHRIDAGMTLRAMAQKMRVSPAFLSATETGRKPVPPKLIEQVAATLGLDDESHDALRKAAEASRKAITVQLGNRASGGDREVAAMFARQFPDLNDEEKDEIRDILGRRAK